MGNIHTISSERTSNVRVTLSSEQVGSISAAVLCYASVPINWQLKCHRKEIVPVPTRLLSVEWCHFLAHELSLWAMASSLEYVFRAFTCRGLSEGRQQPLFQ